LTADNSKDTDIATIGALRTSGRRLALLCGHCHRFRYMNDTRFAESARLDELAGSMTCARCGSEDVELQAVSRDPETGFWPAERS
jgi:hypothetical protein